MRHPKYCRFFRDNLFCSIKYCAYRDESLQYHSLHYHFKRTSEILSEFKEYVNNAVLSPYKGVSRLATEEMKGLLHDFELSFVSKVSRFIGHNSNEVVDQRDSGLSEEENDQVMEIYNDQDSSDGQLTPPEAMTTIEPPLSDHDSTPEDAVFPADFGIYDQEEEYFHPCSCGCLPIHPENNCPLISPPSRNPPEVAYDSNPITNFFIDSNGPSPTLTQRAKLTKRAAKGINFVKGPILKFPTFSRK